MQTSSRIRCPARVEHGNHSDCQSAARDGYNSANRGSFMSATRPVPTETAAGDIPAVPLTVEGYSVLHQMMRFRWTQWRDLPAAKRQAIVNDAVPVLSKMEANASGQSAFYSLLGHKGDLMLV